MNIAANQIREFKGKKIDHLRRTLRRAARDTAILVLLTGFFWSDWLRVVPSWLEVLVLVCFASYIVFELASYPFTRKIRENFAIFILQRSLGTRYKDRIIQVPYSDLKIVKVKKSKGEVVEIHLKSRFRNTIRLSNLENMSELYGLLAERVVKG